MVAPILKMDSVSVLFFCGYRVSGSYLVKAQSWGLERFIKIGLRILAADDSCHREMIGLFVGNDRALQNYQNIRILFLVFASRAYICWQISQILVFWTRFILLVIKVSCIYSVQHVFDKREWFIVVYSLISLGLLFHVYIQYNKYYITK